MTRRIGDYDEAYVRRQTPARLGWKLLGVFLAVGVVLTLTGVAFGWFRTAVGVVSPDNVKAQWQFAYDYSESLNAIAGQWCTARQAEDTESNADAKVQRTSQRIAIEQNYDRVKATFDARLADTFRAKLVKPADVPDRAPTLQQTVTALGCANR